MGLEYVPNELLNSILHYATKAELFALSLVSKTLSLYARPLVRTILYRSVNLTVSARYLGDKARESGSIHFEQRIRDNFLQTILHDSTCAAYIVVLELFIDPSRLPPEIKDQIIVLLRSCTNIEALRLARPAGTGDGDVPFEVLRAIPNTLRRLELKWRPIGPEGLRIVLKRIKSLRTLDLKLSYPIELTSATFSRSQSVRYLSLPLDPFRLHPILPTLLSSLPHLVCFTGSISSAQFLAQVPLVNLHTLRLSCPHYHSQYSKGDNEGTLLAKLSEHLASALQSTPNLRNLSICITAWWWEVKQMSFSIFPDLPISLTSLELLGSTLLPFEALLEYLTTLDRSPNLKRVTVGRLEADGLDEPDYRDYEKFKAVCENRGISGYCTDEAPSWAR